MADSTNPEDTSPPTESTLEHTTVSEAPSDSALPTPQHLWQTPPKEAQDASPPIHQKQFVLCKLLITPLGYMTLCEEGILVKGDGRDHFRQGYYQWYGPLYKKRWTSEGKKDTLLWVIEDEYDMIS